MIVLVSHPSFPYNTRSGVRGKDQDRVRRKVVAALARDYWQKLWLVCHARDEEVRLLLPGGQGGHDVQGRINDHLLIKKGTSFDSAVCLGVPLFFHLYKW
jgi:hypothetical protein